VAYPYTFASLQADNPYTDFGGNQDPNAWYAETDKATATGNTLVAVTEVPQPTFDPATQTCTQNPQPTLVDGVWTLDWAMAAMTTDELAAYQAQAKAGNLRAIRRALQDTDWTELPSVVDTTHPVHLTNQSDFIAYRVALRALAVNPPVTPVVLPTKPAEQWSSAS
jgi:hypothetical protein